MSHRNSELVLEFGRGVKMGHSHKNGMIVAWLILTFRKYVTKVHPKWPKIFINPYWKFSENWFRSIPGKLFQDLLVRVSEDVVRETPLPRTQKMTHRMLLWDCTINWIMIVKSYKSLSFISLNLKFRNCAEVEKIFSWMVFNKWHTDWVSRDRRWNERNSHEFSQLTFYVIRLNL